MARKKTMSEAFEDLNARFGELALVAATASGLYWLMERLEKWLRRRL